MEGSDKKHALCARKTVRKEATDQGGDTVASDVISKMATKAITVQPQYYDNNLKNTFILRRFLANNLFITNFLL